MPRLQNSVTMSGYIATDPSIMGKDRNAARFRIRHDKNRKKGDEWVKEASFFTVITFGAENAEKVSGFKKGKKVILSGALRQNEKEEPGGNKREYVDIIADEVALTDPDGRKTESKQSDDDDWLNA